jgi:ABC-type uncharacterized transport system involved in gliding motility auxiliary subunit
MALTSVLVTIGILIAVNYLSNRRNARWDLTEGSIHSLSEQSQRVLSELDAPLRLVVIDRGVALEQYRDRMSMYDNASTQVSVEYLDYERDPIRAKQLGIEVAPTIVAEYMDRRETVTTVEEREITSAIIRAVTGAERKMYFVQGHGERDPDSQDGSGYAGVTQLLGGDNVVVDTLVLAQQKEIPADATVVAIVGPTADFLDEEVEQLREYVDRGGKLLLTLDPAIGERPQALPKLTAFAREWGLVIGDDVILDVSGRSASASIAVAAPPYPSHPITEGYSIQTVFPLARSVSAASPAPEGRTVQPFVETAAAAWAETDLASLQSGTDEPELDTAAGDLAGPVGLGVAVTMPVATPADTGTGDAGDDAGEDDAEPPQTRIAVLGDSDFASNDFVFAVGNANLFLNTISWLTADENLIAIRPRERGDSRLTITQTQMNAVWWLSIAVVPALVVGAGLVSWSRRRRS